MKPDVAFGSQSDRNVKSHEDRQLPTGSASEEGSCAMF